MLIFKLLPNKLMVLLALMLLHYVPNPHFNASDKKWISLISKPKKLILLFLMLWLLPNNTSNLLWVKSIQHHFVKLMFKSLILNGKISVDYNKQKNNFKK